MMPPKPNAMTYESTSQLQKRNGEMPAAGVMTLPPRRSPKEDMATRNVQASPGQRAGNAMISEYGRQNNSISKIMPNSRENDPGTYAGSASMPAYSSKPTAD